MPLFTPPKIPQNFARIGNTRIYLGGAQYMSLSDPETIELLKRVKVSKVFCLYPINGKDLELLPEIIREKVDWNFPQKLRENGIQVSTIMRNPDHLREYDSFAREANRVGKGNILIMCYGGRHTSAAYAFYYLAKETPMNLAEIRNAFFEAGLSGNDVGRLEDVLRNARADVRKILEEKAAKMEANAKRIKAAAEEAARKTAMERKRLQERKNKQPRRRRF